MMKFLALIALICLGAAQYVHSAPDKMDCSKLDEVLDDLGLAQGLSTMSDKYKLATTKEDFAKRCTEMDEAVKMLKRYNKDCFADSALVQQVFSAILRSRQAADDMYCKDPANAEMAANAGKCIVDNAFQAVNEAEKKTIMGSQVILDAKIGDSKMRMRRACCAVIASKKLFLNATKDKCSAYEKVYSDYVDSYTSEAFALTCEAPEKLECDKLELIKAEGVALKYNFFLNPMLKLVKTLEA